MRPDRLAQAAAAECGNLSAGGDFGSYARANSTGSLAGSGIESHNLVFADARVALYEQIWRVLRLNAIADIGCGLGLTSAALARKFPAARVHGYELSPDAVEFARRSFPQATFECRAIGKDSVLGPRFDLILCQEFYPFTRTADLALQTDILQGLCAIWRMAAVSSSSCRNAITTPPSWSIWTVSPALPSNGRSCPMTGCSAPCRSCLWRGWPLSSWNWRRVCHGTSTLSSRL